MQRPRLLGGHRDQRLGDLAPPVDRHHPEPGLAHRRSRARHVDPLGAHQTIIQDPSAVRPLTALRPPAEPLSGDDLHAHGHETVHFERDQNQPPVVAADEERGPVDRVDDPPPPVAALGLAVLLAEDRVVRPGGGQHRPDRVLDRTVGDGHHGSVLLRLVRQVRDDREVAKRLGGAGQCGPLGQFQIRLHRPILPVPGRGLVG